MGKLIDFDGLFDEKLAQYMEINSEKYTSKQWEVLIPKLYQEFGETFIKSVGDTPKGYYEKMSGKELIETLCAHIREGVPVSDFLSGEIERRKPEELFSLFRSGDEKLIEQAVHFCGDDKRAFEFYFQILVGDAEKTLKESIVELLKENAEEAKERAIALYEKGIEKEFMLEILSRCGKDDRIFEILKREFKLCEDELPLYAGYFASYGDERALPYLLEEIEREDLNYLEFRELKFAIEALGGEYTKERNFTEDPYYRQIFSNSNEE